ncbi:hypothetical protein ACTVZO_06375 [Streptomyces sp. IBSNAI002]|uniref:hypothetical protein n=1 Tax=Streptomyces sp. IBSNAI002 TaxID=3457500 RepID=UPI003FCF56DE
MDGIRWISGRPFPRLGLLYATVTNFFCAYFTTYQLQRTPDTHRGRVMSVANICGAGGAAIAPFAAGAAFDWCGRPATLLACSTLLGLIALSPVLGPVMRRPPEAPAVEEVGDGTGPVPQPAR